MVSDQPFYIKIISKNSDGSVGIELYTHVFSEKTIMTIPKNSANGLTEKLSEIQLGFVGNCIDTTDPDIILQMSIRDEHVALAIYYITPEGSLYRRMTPPQAWQREKYSLIEEFYEFQAILRGLIDNGYKALPDVEECEICNFICKTINENYREAELASGRIPCIGEGYGCMETTNGSQYCCRTYCPSENDHIINETSGKQNDEFIKLAVLFN